MLQSITVFNELGNGHRLCAGFNMEVFSVVCRLGGSAAIDAVCGCIPGERGRDLNPLQPRRGRSRGREVRFPSVPVTKAAAAGEGC